MNIRFKDLAAKGGPATFHERINIQDLVSNRTDIISAQPLEAALTAVSVQGGAEVHGPCSADVEYACSRCLRQFTDKLAFDFDEMFSPLPEQEDVSDEDFTVYVGDELFDLLPFVEESVLLELPMAPLCEEDCKGLCPECGTNRNDSACGCNPVKVDPRLADLQNFFNKDK